MITANFMMRLCFVKLLLLACSCVVLMPMLRAQSGVEAGSQEAPELRASALQIRLDAVRADAALAEPTKAAVVDSLTLALDAARRAEELHTLAGTFRSARDSAPQALKNAREELAQEPVPVAIAPAEGSSLVDLEQQLLERQAEQKVASQALLDVEREANQRTARRTAIPAQLITAKQALEATPETFQPIATVDPLVNEARRLRHGAELLLAVYQVAALDAELGSYESRTDLLVVRRDLAARRNQLAAVSADAWQNAVQEQRSTSAVQAEADAKRAAAEASAQHPLLARLATENAEIAANLPFLASEQKYLELELVRLRAMEVELQQQYEDAQARVKRAGSSRVIGALLRQLRAQLLMVDRTIRPRRLTPGLTATEVYLAAQKWTDQRVKHVDDVGAAQRLVANAKRRLVTSGREQDLLPRVVEFRAERTAMLDGLAKGWASQLANFEDRVVLEQQLTDLSRRFRTFINERVLWIRSSQPIWSLDSEALLAAALWFGEPSRLSALGRASVASVTADPFSALCLLVFLAVLLTRRYWLRRLREVGAEAARGSNTRYAPTLWALLHTLMLAMPVPALLWLVSAHLADDRLADPVMRSMAAGIRDAGGLLALVLGWREVVRTGGLADQHFKWQPSTLQSLRRNLVLLVPVAVPLTICLRALEHHADDAWLGSLGRLLLLGIVALLATFLWRVMHPSSGLLAVRKGSTWLGRFRRLWFAVVIFAPLVLVVMIVMGFEYTALQLVRRMVFTVALLLACVLGQAMILRSLLLARRKLVLAQRAERTRLLREERAASSESGVAAIEELPVDHGLEVPLDAGSITAQTQALLRSAVVLFAVVVVWGIWIEVLPALGVLRDVHVWGDPATPVTLADLLLSVLAIVATVFAAKNAPGLLELLILQRLKMQSGERHAITTLARYLLITIGVVYAFGAIGIGWSKVQFLVAGLTLGLGFGLQEIFANFISGLILLFERPVRVGDLVVLGDLLGKVTRIKIRATTIRDLENKELVVPNKEFVTGRFVNWTLSDSYVRMTLPVGIAYGSDTRKAKELMLKAAAECSYVAKSPAPRALFLGFGDSALSIELRIYVEDYDQHTHLLDDLHTRIDDAFREHGIEIAFPQQDVHLRTARPLVEFMDRRGEPRAD